MNSGGDDSERRRIHESAVDDLLASLDSETSRERNAASIALARRARDDPDHLVERLPELASYLGHSDGIVRTQTSAAIVSIAERNPSALVGLVPTLVEGLDDDFSLVRRNVLEALFEVAKTDPEPVEPATDALMAQLDRDEAFVRVRAVHVLMHIARGTPGAVVAHVPDLVSLLREDQGEPDLGQAAEALPSSLPPHESQRDMFHRITEDEQARWKSSREGIALILATLAPEHPERYRPYVADLASLTTDESMLVRKSATEMLACVAEVNAHETQVAIPVLRDRLRDDNAEIVRARAAWALALLCAENKAVLEEVSADLSALAELLESDDTEVRTAAANLLAYVAETHPERVASMQLEGSRLVDDESAAVRRQAAWIFAFLRDEKSKRQLERLRNQDADPGIRDLAAELVQSIDEDGDLVE